MKFRSNTAFTLFELLMSLSLITVLLLLTTQSVTQSLQHWTRTQSIISIEESTHRALEQIALEIESFNGPTQIVGNREGGIGFYENNEQIFAYVINSENNSLIRKENTCSEIFLKDCKKIFITANQVTLQTSKGKTVSKRLGQFQKHCLDS